MHIAHAHFHKKGKVQGVDNTSVDLLLVSFQSALSAF